MPIKVLSKEGFMIFAGLLYTIFQDRLFKLIFEKNTPISLVKNVLVIKIYEIEMELILIGLLLTVMMI